MIRQSVALAALLASLMSPNALAAALADDAIEAPELGRAGPMQVGSSYSEIALSPQLQLTAQGPVATPRSIGLRLWFPAKPSKAGPVTYRHTITMSGGKQQAVVEQGMAREAAAPLAGSFPLIILSHGYGGWSEQLSRLGEHLASRGYVVASIDHRDATFTSATGFLISFGNVIANRANDQRALLAKLGDRAFVAANPGLVAADVSRIGLLGYSMGGFGALATAGATYDPAGKPFAALPEAIRKNLLAPDAASAARIKALVLISPWGGQPDNRAWSAEGLATLKAPLLMIAGDQDDVVNFKDGARWLFDTLKPVDRHLLVYRDARHNVVGNASDLGPSPDPSAAEFLREPVWRQERINQTNQHFTTAFLDQTLKGDATKKAYLDVPTPIASDGQWPVKFGETNTPPYAGDGQPGYWRGFRRRWAMGLEMHGKAAGQ